MPTPCEIVTDELDELVAGDSAAIARHADHLAACDDCRDARHEATRLAELLAGAGADHVLAPDLLERVLAAAAPAPEVSPAATLPGIAPAAPAAVTAPEPAVTAPAVTAPVTAAVPAAEGS